MPTDPSIPESPEPLSDSPCDWMLAFGYGHWCLTHNSGNVFRPSHTDLGHHGEPLDRERASRVTQPTVAALREAVGRYIVAMTRRASGGTTDAEVRAAYEAMYDAAALPVQEATPTATEADHAE